MNFWQSVPFARIALPFASGIFMAEMYGEMLPFLWLWILIPAIFIFSIAHTAFVPMRLQFNLKGASLIITLISMGFLQHYVSDERIRNDYFGQQSGEMMLVKVISRPEIREKNVRMDVQVLAIYQMRNWISSSGKIKLYIKDEKGKKVQAGQLLQVQRKALAAPPKVLNPYGFDYARYLHLNDIHHVAFPDSTQWAKTSDGNLNIFIRQVYALQDYLHHTYSSYFKDKNDRSIMEALTFGYKSELDHNALEVYSKTGVIHVLAVSGLHVGLIYSCLQYLTFFLSGTPFRRKIRAALMVSALTCYAFLTGLSPSVNRAVVMFIMFVLADVTGKNNHSLNSLFSSAFLLLLIEPLWLFNAGFQLSYLAVAGILLIHPRIEKLFKVKNRFIRKISTLISVSLAAQMATFPLCIYLFHQFPNLFLPANLIAIPATTVLLILGSILPILHPVRLFSPVSKELVYFSEQILNLNENLLKWLSELPYALTENLYVSTGETWLLYGIISGALVFSSRRSLFSLRLTVLLTFALLFSFSLRTYQNIRNSGWICFVFKNQAIPGYKAGRNLILFCEKEAITEDIFLPYFRAECGGRISFLSPLTLTKSSLIKIQISGKNEIYLSRGINKRKLKIIPEKSTFISITPMRLYEQPKFNIVTPALWGSADFSNIHILKKDGFWKK